MVSERASEFGGNGWYRSDEENRKRAEDRRRVEERLQRERTGKDYPYNYSKRPY